MKSGLTEFERDNLKNFSSHKAIEEFDKVGFYTVEKTIVEKYFTKKNAKVLDIGCGIGRTTVPLFEMGFDVIGIDLSNTMIDNAKARSECVDFRVGDACDLKFSNKSFDYVLFSFNGIDLIYPEEKRIMALKEINKVLKDDGIFVFSSHNPMQFLSHGFRRCINHWHWLSRFVILNIIRRRFFSKYKIEKHNFGEFITYYIKPFKQREQLESNRFELLDFVGGFEGKMKNFEPWLYYVAQKTNGKA